MRNTVILATRSTGTSPPVMAGIAPWSMQPCAVPVPVALTALAAILGMIPLAGSIFWGPMAIAIMGGLLVATVLTLVVVPALYALWFRVRADERAGAPDPFEPMERPDEAFVPIRIAAE
jgi:hypothetical protein